jgi:hypothetical protein
LLISALELNKSRLGLSPKSRSLKSSPKVISLPAGLVENQQEIVRKSGLTLSEKELTEAQKNQIVNKI